MKLKIVIVTNGNIFSTMVLEKTLKMYYMDIPKVYITTKVPGRRSSLDNLIEILRFSGLKYFLFKVTYNLFIPIIAKMFFKKVLLRNFTKEYNIETKFVNEINSNLILKEIEDIRPDLLISVSSTQKFSKKLIAIPEIPVNLHFSLLPKYGGISPYVWCLVNNEHQTGVTIHKIEPRLDSGPIILQKGLTIKEGISAFNLAITLAKLSSDMLVKVLNLVEKDTISLYPQDLTQRAYYKHPSRKDISEMERNGYNLITLADFKYLYMIIKNLQ